MSGAETGRKALHWWILGFMAIGVIVGATIQSMTEGPGSIGAKVVDAEGGVRVESIRTSLLPKGRKPTEALAVGDVISALVLDKGVEGRERRIAVESAAGLRATLDEVGYGMVASLERVGGAPRSVTLELEPTSSRNSLIEPFRFVADIFMRLLKMLIVPLVLTSIITGVTGLGGGATSAASVGGPWATTS